MKEKMKKMKKGQVGIFIVLSIILLSVFVFLITTSTDEKVSVLKEDKEDSQNTKDFSFPLKDSIDLCLSQELKKATIVAGLRGFLIYDEGENYAPSNGVYEYDINFLNNLGLNRNYLSSTIIHSQFGVFMPDFDQIVTMSFEDGTNKIIYNHTIEEDFERHILFGLGDCLKFEDLNDEGYTLDAENFGGKIVNFDSGSGILTISDMDGEVGDRVNFDFEGKLYYGTITQVEEDLIYADVNLNEVFIATTYLEGTDVINLNADINVSVSFEDESISAKLKYPMLVEKASKKIYFDETEIFVEARFKKMKELAARLLREKSTNRLLDLSNATQINEIISKIKYFQGTNKRDLDFIVTVVESTLDYKLYTYSIIDHDSKIFDAPLVFNFGYENHAPQIDLSSVGTVASQYAIEYKNMPLNVLHSYPLAEVTSDREVLDNYISYFLNTAYVGPGIEYRIGNDGVLYFMATVDKKVSFEISVTDGETINTYPVNLIMGLPSNADMFVDLRYSGTDTKAYTKSEDTYNIVETGVYQVALDVGSSPAIAEGTIYVPFRYDFTMTGSPNGIVHTATNVTYPAIWSNLIYASKSILEAATDSSGGGRVNVFDLDEVKDTIYSYGNDMVYSVVKTTDTSSRVVGELKLSLPNLYDKEDPIGFEIVFPYENDAPSTNLGLLGGSVSADGMSVSFNLGVDEVFSRGLISIVSDAQPYDRVNNIVFSSSASYMSNEDVYYSLDDGGSIYFKAKTDEVGSYSIPFRVSDGELMSEEYTLKFNIVG